MEERISEHEDRMIDINHSEQQRELDWKKFNRACETCGTMIKDQISVPGESRKEMRKRVGLKKYLKKQWLKILQTWQKIQTYRFKKTSGPQTE